MFVVPINLHAVGTMRYKLQTSKLNSFFNITSKVSRVYKHYNLI